PRMQEAVWMVQDAQQADGTWLLQHVLPGEVWFEIDVAVGRPSPWLSMQALRVRRWWNAGGARTRSRVGLGARRGGAGSGQRERGLLGCRASQVRRVTCATSVTTP